MPLVNYSSSESGSESESENLHNVKKLKLSLDLTRLPLPNAIKNIKPLVATSLKSNPEDHDGRARNFEHERGNWATYVYIPGISNDITHVNNVRLSIIIDLQESIKEFLKNKCNLKSQNDLHISLTKTIILRHHWINAFVKSIKNSLCATDEFIISLSNLKIYCNEEKTRTFIALAVDAFNSKIILSIMEKMDVIMDEFRLEKFYQNPSFHTSILWCVGDCSDLLNRNISSLQNILDDYLIKSSREFQLKIKNIMCKTGNKIFNFPLL